MRVIVVVVVVVAAAAAAELGEPAAVAASVAGLVAVAGAAVAAVAGAAEFVAAAESVADAAGAVVVVVVVVVVVAAAAAVGVVTGAVASGRPAAFGEKAASVARVALTAFGAPAGCTAAPEGLALSHSGIGVPQGLAGAEQPGHCKRADLGACWACKHNWAAAAVLVRGRAGEERGSSCGGHGPSAGPIVSSVVTSDEAAAARGRGAGTRLVSAETQRG